MTETFLKADASAGALPDAVSSYLAYFARLFEYDRWANGRALDAMRSLGDRLPARPVHRLSHLLICQEMWVGRMTRSPRPITDFFPSWTLAEAATRAASIGTLVQRFIESIDDAMLLAEFEYTSSEGGRYRNRPIDVLTQLSQHGCYHRGQIALELNPLLPAPISTDYIVFSRIG